MSTAIAIVSRTYSRGASLCSSTFRPTYFQKTQWPAIMLISGHHPWMPLRRSESTTSTPDATSSRTASFSTSTLLESQTSTDMPISATTTSTLDPAPARTPLSSSKPHHGLSRSAKVDTGVGASLGGLVRLTVLGLFIYRRRQKSVLVDWGEGGGKEKDAGLRVSELPTTANILEMEAPVPASVVGMEQKPGRGVLYELE